MTAPTTLAVVPARAGSKAIPGKNLADLGGRPLVAWAVLIARASTRADRVVCSTDDDTIADAAKAAGAEVPFRRPAELAADDTPGIAPVLHAVRRIAEAEGAAPDVVVCLQPTSPFRTPADVDAALAVLEERDADAVVSVTEPGHHPAWMKRMDDEGRLTGLEGTGDVPAVRQDLDPVYALNGAIYAARADVLLREETWYTDRTYGYLMPPERSLDVDTPWDLRLARLLWDKVGPPVADDAVDDGQAVPDATEEPSP